MGTRRRTSVTFKVLWEAGGVNLPELETSEKVGEAEWGGCCSCCFQECAVSCCCCWAAVLLSLLICSSWVSILVFANFIKDLSFLFSSFNLC